MISNNRYTIKSDVIKLLVFIPITLLTIICGQDVNGKFIHLFCLFVGGITTYHLGYGYCLVFLLNSAIGAFSLNTITAAVSSFLGIMALAFFKLKTIRRLFREDKYITRILKISILFTLYEIFITYGIRDDMSSVSYYFVKITYIFGVFAFIPAYVAVFINRKELLIAMLSMGLVSGIVYLLSYFQIVELFKFEESVRTGLEEETVRMMGDTIKQSVKVFIYLLPAVLFIRVFSAKTRLSVIVISILAVFSVMVALYRLEIFYISMGILTTTFLVKKYFKVKSTKIILIALILAIPVFVVASSFIHSIIDSISNLFADNVQQIDDESSEVRYLFELPYLIELFSRYFLFGAGASRATGDVSTFWYWSDLPLMGSFAAFGIAGMTIYFIRYYFILNRFYRFLKGNDTEMFVRKYPAEFAVVLGLCSYFITLIFTKLFYVTWEQIQIGGQIEFGVFIGILFALIRFLENVNNDDKRLSDIRSSRI
ncbi:MAG: hypothetical protein J1E02_07005 [Coprobacter sp.]|nr:hypothetical protein [Coprobacter sp.]